MYRLKWADESSTPEMGAYKIDNIQGGIKVCFNFVLRYSNGEELLQLKGDVCQIKIIHFAVLSQIRFQREEFAVGFGGCTNDSCDFCSDVRPGGLPSALLKSSQIEEGSCESLTGDGITIEWWVEEADRMSWGENDWSHD